MAGWDLQGSALCIQQKRAADCLKKYSEQRLTLPFAQLCFQDATNLFDLGVSKSKIPHSVIGKYMNTLLSN